jgi:hypothetical protein
MVWCCGFKRGSGSHRWESPCRDPEHYAQPPLIHFPARDGSLMPCVPVPKENSRRGSHRIGEPSSAFRVQGAGAYSVYFEFGVEWGRGERLVCSRKPRGWGKRRQRRGVIVRLPALEGEGVTLSESEKWGGMEREGRWWTKEQKWATRRQAEFILWKRRHTRGG